MLKSTFSSRPLAVTVSHLVASALTALLVPLTAHAQAWPADLPTLGPERAPVTIVVASEFQCPFCSRVVPTLRELTARHPGQIRLVFANLPLPFHRHAQPAAVAAMAAHKQGKFWAYHDKLFADPSALGDARYLEVANDVGLDIPKFKRDLLSPAVQSQVTRVQQALESLGVRGTPSCFLNGSKLTGAQPIEAFEAAFTSALADAKAAAPTSGDAMHQLAAIWEHHAPGAGKALVETLLLNKPAPALATPAAPPPEPEPKDDPTVWRVDINVGRDIVVGDNPLVKLTLVLFTDLQCPFCARVQPSLAALVAKHGSGLRLVYKHYPLPFHAQAMPMHRAVLAAHRQGKFGPYFMKLLAIYRTMTADTVAATLAELATSAGLDPERFASDMLDPALDAQIAADKAQGESVGVSGTPTLFVNGRAISGAVPLAAMQAVVDQELAKAKAAGDVGHAYYLRAIAAGKRIATE